LCSVLSNCLISVNKNFGAEAQKETGVRDGGRPTSGMEGIAYSQIKNENPAEIPKTFVLRLSIVLMLYEAAVLSATV
jgi:hypothetical protein